jgi:ATP-dependent helicase/nuclease subunit B
MPARVFTIPASAPFLPTLIGALKEGRLVEGVTAGDLLALARATLFLPTQRAGQLTRAAFLDGLATNAAVLPRIVPLGEIDEDELIFANAASGAAALDLPEPLGGLERRMLLARLVMRWAERLDPHAPGSPPVIVHSPAAALALADDLARLIDDMTTRQVPWDKLDTLVPDRFDVYWQLTLKFLQIARETWPAILTERDRIEPAARRDLLIEQERLRLAASDGPVIAAGSTGSMPATAKLLATIATLPHGAVVLPGLDTDLDAETWDLIGGSDGATTSHGHPQFAMHALLARIGIGRDDVLTLGARGARERFLSEALRPAAATERWAARLGDATRSDALAGVTMIEAANAEEEATAIAVALREATEQRKTAALVTPDRALARRVGAALARWTITADDSGGDALPDTEAGVFARLVAQTVLEGLAPVRLLALVKHARLRLGAAAGAHARAIAALERAVLRGPRPKAGTEGLAGALTRFRGELAKFRRGGATELHRSDPRTTIADADLDAAQALVASLADALTPLEGLTGRHAFVALAERHSAVLTALSRDDAGSIAAFARDDGAELAKAFAEIAEQRPSDDLTIDIGDYAELFETAIAPQVCRRPGSPGERVRILGPLEARLVTVDRVVLGGLVEGVWPPDARTDPWLSRPMRLDLGLDLPERRIGLSAHDFAQLAGTREVVLTRAAKLSGAPTVASRFVQRLAAVAGEQWQDALERGETYVAWARALDRPQVLRRIRRPEPKPPRAARPKQLSVTEIEHWLRDPYTIYAKHVLRLAPLDTVDTLPGARDRGTVIHGAIGEFTERFAGKPAADPLAALLAIGEDHFAALQDYPEARAFWWPRFRRIACWFVSWEAERRASTTAVHAERYAKLEIPLGERTFMLTTRVDRIEQRAGGYAILDYKTGSLPTEKQVRTGLSPQLTLEAAILRAGAFKDIPGGSIAELAYVGLKGGEPPGTHAPLEFKKGTADSQADKARSRLTAIALRFEDEATPYRSLVSPMWKARYGDYDHLARVKEWSAMGGEDEDDGAPA